MARYIVVRVESNDSADKLVKKLDEVNGVQTVGVFVSPTKFCPGKAICGGDTRKLQTSRRWGTLHCTTCKLPVSSLPQNPRNLLNDPDLHPRFNDLRLEVWEPYSDPISKYGPSAIEAKNRQMQDAKVKIQRHKQRKKRQG